MERLTRYLSKLRVVGKAKAKILRQKFATADYVITGNFYIGVASLQQQCGLDNRQTQRLYDIPAVCATPQSPVSVSLL